MQQYHTHRRINLLHCIYKRSIPFHSTQTSFNSNSGTEAELYRSIPKGINPRLQSYIACDIHNDYNTVWAKYRVMFQNSVIGYFDMSSSPQPPGFEQFYYSAMRIVEAGNATSHPTGLMTMMSQKTSSCMSPSTSRLTIKNPDSQSRLPGFALHRCRFEARAVSFSPRRPSSLGCANECEYCVQ